MKTPSKIKQTRIDFWDSLYKTKGKIYGDEPSQFAKYLSHALTGKNCGNSLELAGGYGRNCVILAQNGIQVTCNDTSYYALEIGRNECKKRGIDNIKFVQEDVLEMVYNEDFDVIFSNFIFHLFLKEEREEIFKRSCCALKGNGYFLNTFLSIEDADFGIGKEFETNTYLKEDEPNKPQHFFTKGEVEELHTKHGFSIEVIETSKEMEWLAYKNLRHEINFWQAIARKRVQL